MTAPARSFSDDSLVVLQHAAQITKDENIRQIDTLRRRLLPFYPDREMLVETALARWATYVHKLDSESAQCSSNGC